MKLTLVEPMKRDVKADFWSRWQIHWLTREFQHPVDGDVVWTFVRRALGRFRDSKMPRPLEERAGHDAP